MELKRIAFKSHRFHWFNSGVNKKKTGITLKVDYSFKRRCDCKATKTYFYKLHLVQIVLTVLTSIDWSSDHLSKAREKDNIQTLEKKSQFN